MPPIRLFPICLLFLAFADISCAPISKNDEHLDQEKVQQIKNYAEEIGTFH